MIKLIIFDLDGVLVDARELHYEAMNMALEVVSPQHVINREEHLSTYDGLPTKKKLAILTKNKNLPLNKHTEIWKKKQDSTLKIINGMEIDYRMAHILSELKKEGYKIYVGSNSIKQTIKMMLLRRGLLEFIDEIFSNEDVSQSKPHPEMYLRCMIRGSAAPKETLIIEDSHVGRKAALDSGANLFPVKNTSDVILEDIRAYINKINANQETKPKWRGNKMNVLIPMAGAGSRFQQAGYTFPKPLIEIDGKPMIQLVVENLNIDANHIFVVQKTHYDQYNFKHLLNLISPGCKIVQVDKMTEGAACTTLLAKEFINNDEPLLFANSDQFLEWDSNEFMYSMEADEVDGGILTFTATHPKWSFAKLNEEGFVAEVAEKKPISDIATAGIYYWKHGRDYVKYAEQMIKNNTRFNNEFYVCPVFNEAIRDSKKIKTFHFNGMWGIGTPEDLNYFLKNYGK